MRANPCHRTVLPNRGCVRRLFRLRPDVDVAAGVELDVDHVGTTTDGAVLDVLLDGARRSIERDDDFLAAGIAGVAGFVDHVGIVAAGRRRWNRAQGSLNGERGKSLA